MTGSANAQETKAQGLFDSLWDIAWVGGVGANNAYPSIHEIMSRMGVNTTNLDPHQHHFHIALKVPDRQPILPNGNLIATLGGDQPMLSLDAIPNNPVAALVVAQTNSTSANTAPIPSWMKSDPRLQRLLDIKQGKSEYAASPFKYNPNGGLGIPSLTIQLDAEWAPVIPKSLALREKNGGTGFGTGVYLKAPGTNGQLYVGPMMINPARHACEILDLAMGKELGDWGPECKVSKMLESPDGRLVRRDPKAEGRGPSYQEGDYYFTPAGKNTRDTIRSILENGAGKQVEVIYNIRVGNDRMQRGSLDSGTDQQVELADDGEVIFAWLRSAQLSAVLADASQVLQGFSDLAGAVVGNTVGEGSSAQITLDNTAAGHGGSV